jgi:hypothetical protein
MPAERDSLDTQQWSLSEAVHLTTAASLGVQGPAGFDPGLS